MDLWQYGWSDYMGTLNIYHLVMTNVAMGNGPFIEAYLLKIVTFHGYVK